MDSLIDTHCHLLKDYYQENIQNIVDRALKKNVTRMINISTNVDSIKEVVSSYTNIRQVFGALGLHPQESGSKKLPLSLLNSHAKDSKVVAIGEIGFDLYRENSEYLLDKQREDFKNQMAIAERHKLPVIIHSRNATQVTLMELRKYPKIKKVVHCFSENSDVMEKYLQIPNTYISFTGIVTFKNAKEVQEAFLKCPNEKFMLETDAPFLSPTPLRGKKNEPAHINHIASFLSKIKNMSYSEIASISTTNAYRFFERLY